MILPYLTSPTRTRCRTTPTPRKGVVVRQNGAAPAVPLPHLRYGRYGRGFVMRADTSSCGACEPVFQSEKIAAPFAPLA